ncbi:AAA family ATPase [Streptomyces sp. NPDC000878]
MTFVERAEEILLLESLLNEALGGAGRVVSVTGPVGSGKTELAHQLAARATDQGVRVVLTHASPAGVGAGPGIFGQLLEACSSAAELRHRLAEDGSAHAMSSQLMLAICHDLLRSAAQTPLLLIADDVHLTDAESLRGLLYLVRHARVAPVMLVLVTSEYSQQTIPLFHAELFREPHHRQIQLPLLSVDGVTGILSERLDDATAHRLAPAAHAATGGNPLVVRALLEEHLMDPSAGGESLRPGDTSATAVLACLHHSGQPGLDVARGIALLGDRATPELISKLVSRPRRQVKRFSAALSQAGLLGPDGSLRHPAARSVVLNDPGFENASELRYRAAELLHSEGETPLRVAEHLIAADRPVRHWHISLLRQAAEDALDSQQADLALQCLDLALRDCPDGEERALITAAKVRVEWRMNPARAMSHFAGLLNAFEQGHLPDLEAIMLARALMWHGREEEAAGILTKIRARPHTPEVGEALLSTDQSLRSTHPESVVLLPERPTDPRPTCEDPCAGPLVDSVMWDFMQAGNHEDTARVAEGVLRNDHSPDYWRGPHSNALCALLYVHELDRAEYWTTRIYQSAEAEGFRTWQAVRAGILSEVARRRGDLPAAVRLAREGLRLMGPRAWGPQIEMPLSSLISAATAAGHHRTAAEWLAFPRPGGASKTRYYLHFLEARGHHHLAMGRYLPALRDFLACGRLMKSWDMDIAGIVPWRLGVAEALLRLGRRERAARVLDEQAERPDAHHPRVQGPLLRLRAGTMKPRQAVVLLRKSDDLLDSNRLPVELLATLMELNRVYVELGDSHQARFTARRIWRTAAQCGAEAHVRQTLLPEFAAPHSGTGAPAVAEDDMQTVLSDAELRVAELAARGHTNREIAGRLYITVSTVEQHLTRVYRKLQVDGRVDLQIRLNTKLQGTA